MSYLTVIFGLMAIIVIHELGHFLAARAVGIRATKFYVFFPPAAARWQRGDVEYGLGWIPLGGFVKMPGMFKPRPDDVHWRLEPSVEEVLQGAGDGDLRMQLQADYRAVGRAETPEALGATLEQLDATLARIQQSGHPPTGSFAEAPRASFERKVRKLRGHVRDHIDDCHPNAYWRASLPRRMAVILAGPMANVVLAFVVLFTIFSFFMPKIEQEMRVNEVVPGSPAAHAGMQEGDRVVAWNGASADDPEAFVKRFQESRGEPVEITVERDGERRTFEVAPTEMDGEPRIGVGLRTDLERVGTERNAPGEALSLTTAQMAGYPVAMAHALTNIAQGEDRGEVMSIVGIVREAPEVEQLAGLPYYIAMLSLVIAVMNMLPLLPLDGGHVLFGFFEFLRRGRPLARETFERFSMVGLVLILGLFMIGLQNDLMG